MKKTSERSLYASFPLISTYSQNSLSLFAKYGTRIYKIDIWLETQADTNRQEPVFIWLIKDYRIIKIVFKRATYFN